MRRLSLIRLALTVFLAAGLDFGYVSPAQAQSSSAPDFDYVAEGRGVWIGLRSRGDTNWDSTMAALSQAGYNMVFPNMCTGGAALYPSEVLPMISQRDELKLCLEAAHKHGIEVHVWRINWFMSSCPDSFTTAMEQAGRIQYSFEGKRNPELMKNLGYRQNRDWLCPSNPLNRKLEFDSMLELVRKYDVDGVHFDYMRYGAEEMCFCPVCRANFEKESGLAIADWPAEVWKEGRYREAYLDWRRQLIGSLAREIARAVHTLDPYVCVSLAARSGISWAYDSDAQVWWDWIGEGSLDFVCPMNYTTEPDRFVTVMQSHLPLVKGAVPYYSGLGVYEMKTFEQMQKNIELGRALGQDGFVAFELRSLLPQLERSKKELTAAKALLPHRAPETHFEFGAADRQSPEGFPVYGPDKEIGCSVSVMFKGKIREGIERIRGDFTVRSLNEDKRILIRSVDLNKGARIELACPGREPGRYRLALSGTLTLSTGEERPFSVGSFPFEVKSD